MVTKASLLFNAVQILPLRMKYFGVGWFSANYKFTDENGLEKEIEGVERQFRELGSRDDPSSHLDPSFHFLPSCLGPSCLDPSFHFLPSCLDPSFHFLPSCLDPSCLMH